jgi:hypothetical protein
MLLNASKPRCRPNLKGQIDMSQHETERSDPLRGLVYFPHPTTKKLALYVAYEFQAGHTYRIDVTSDGVNYSTLTTKSVPAGAHEVYESFNVPDPGNGLWPRVIDLGLAPAPETPPTA